MTSEEPAQMPGYRLKLSIESNWERLAINHSIFAEMIENRSFEFYKTTGTNKLTITTKQAYSNLTATVVTRDSFMTMSTDLSLQGAR